MANQKDLICNFPFNVSNSKLEREREQYTCFIPLINILVEKEGNCFWMKFPLQPHLSFVWVEGIACEREFRFGISHFLRETPNPRVCFAEPQYNAKMYLFCLAREVNSYMKKLRDLLQCFCNVLSFVISCEPVSMWFDWNFCVLCEKFLLNQHVKRYFYIILVYYWCNLELNIVL